MKYERQMKIKELIEHEIIETQEELAERLKAAGIEVTQATVSRDIKELGLVKVPSMDNRYRYSVPENTFRHRDQERMGRMFRDSVLRMDYSENLIVIKTLPGTAQAVASTIDNSDDQRIIGTVAGDDTILIIVKPIQAVMDVFEKFSTLARRV